MAGVDKILDKEWRSYLVSSLPEGVSQGPFDHLIVQLEHWLLNIRGKAPFNRLADFGFDLFNGLALGCAAGYRRHFGPEPSLLGFVNNHSDSHRLTFNLVQLELRDQEFR